MPSAPSAFLLNTYDTPSAQLIRGKILSRTPYLTGGAILTCNAHYRWRLEKDGRVRIVRVDTPFSGDLSRAFLFTMEVLNRSGYRWCGIKAAINRRGVCYLRSGSFSGPLTVVGSLPSLPVKAPIQALTYDTLLTLPLPLKIKALTSILDLDGMADGNTIAGVALMPQKGKKHEVIYFEVKAENPRISSTVRLFTKAPCNDCRVRRLWFDPADTTACYLEVIEDLTECFVTCIHFPTKKVKEFKLPQCYEVVKGAKFRNRSGMVELLVANQQGTRLSSIVCDETENCSSRSLAPLVGYHPHENIIMGYTYYNRFAAFLQDPEYLVMSPFDSSLLLVKGNTADPIPLPYSIPFSRDTSTFANVLGVVAQMRRLPLQPNYLLYSDREALILLNSYLPTYPINSGKPVLLIGVVPLEHPRQSQLYLVRWKTPARLSPRKRNKPTLADIIKQRGFGLDSGGYDAFLLGNKLCICSTGPRTIVKLHLPASRAKALAPYLVAAKAKQALLCAIVTLPAAPLEGR